MLDKPLIYTPLGDEPNEKLYFKDYAEFDAKVSNDHVNKNYDEDNTRWGNREAGVSGDSYNAQNEATQGSYFGGAVSRVEGDQSNFSGKLRPDYDPRQGSKILKRVSTVFNTPNNSVYGLYSENHTIRHWGGNSEYQGSGRGDFLPGLFLYYTPVRNDSLIIMQAQFSTYVTQNSYQMWTGSWRVGDDDIGGWQHRSYVSGPNTHAPISDCNSWGSGLQKCVCFVMNSYNNSYKTGIYGSDHNGFSRRLTITEIENPNPYGPAVTAWSPESIYF